MYRAAVVTLRMAILFSGAVVWHKDRVAVAGQCVKRDEWSYVGVGCRIAGQGYGAMKKIGSGKKIEDLLVWAFRAVA